MLLRLERGFVLQPPGLVQRKAAGFAFSFNLQMRDAMMFRIAIVLAVFVVTCALPRHASAEFRAGAAVVDVAPLKLPVLVNGNLVIRTVASVKTPLNSRAIVRHDVDLAMAESRMNLNYRVPDAQRLKWAREIVDAMGDRSAQNSTEFYAVQQILLHQKQSTEIVVQALRIGDIAITTTPNETYALTGLKLKLQSPLPKTMVIELANGADGYIPPPEQHLLGGYNTWAARSAGLEVQAEPKITETALGLLETVSARSRRVFRQGRGPLAEALLDAQPIAWWRLDEFAAPHAADSSARANDAVYEPGVVFFLDGPESERFCAAGETNRSAHFAGGRLRSRLAETLSDRYSVSVWIWNGMPIESRDVTGWMLSRGHDHGLGADSDHLGLGGTAGHTGRLIYQHGNDAENRTGGKTEIPRWQWNHVVFVRDGHNVRVHLNGGASPEIDIELSDDSAITSRNLFFGGRSDNRSNWEGRLDEIAVFDRALSPEEIAKLSPSRD